MRHEHRRVSVEGLMKRQELEVWLFGLPCQGGPSGAGAASLSIMFGGDMKYLKKAKTVLEKLVQDIHLGPIGSGQVVKMCNKMLLQ